MPQAPLTMLTPTTTGTSVTLPDGNFMKATHESVLPFSNDTPPPSLSTKALTTQVFPSLSSANLISVGQLCDDDCIVTFTKNTMLATHNNTIIMQAPRNPRNGLWETQLPIPQPPLSTSSFPAPTTLQQPTCNGIIRKETSIHDLVNYLHACCFSPTKSTFLKAIKNDFLLSWPGLNPKTVRKYLKTPEATAKGHLDQEQQGLQSTQTITPPQRTNIVMATTFSVPTGKIFTDQTGRFPVQSSRGYNYIFVLYDYDSNAILTKPLKSRSSNSIVTAFLATIQHLTKRGLVPTLHILDNEASSELKTAITKNNISFQLAPPHIHRRNAAERAIRTFKDHFIAGLATCDPAFPLSLWDRLLPQAELTLNLLRPSRLNPKLSAYAYLNGNFNFSATPLAPPGIKCQAHLKPEQRRSFGSHSLTGWYVGPSFEHYRCYKVYNPTTGHERICDTVEFFPATLKLPATSTLDKVHQASIDLIELLQKNDPASPFLDFGNAQHNALQQLADMLKEAAKPKKTTEPSTAPQPPLHLVLQQPSIPAPQPRVPSQPPTAPPTAQTPTPVPASPATQPRGVQPAKTPTCRKPRKQRTPKSTPSKATRAKRRSRRQHKPPQHLQHFATSAIEEIPMSLPPPIHIDQLANPVLDEATGRSMEYRHLIQHPDPQVRKRWSNAMCNELGRLAQGYKNQVQFTNCIHFIAFSDIPPDKLPTYARIVAELRPQKEDPYRIRITAGGNLVFYPWDKSQPTADLPTVKLHINSTISTPGAKYMCLDIKNMYLQSTMPKPEYLGIPVKLIPPEFIEEYNLHHLIYNDMLYVRIDKGMYGLPQAGKLAHDQLKAHLKTYDYEPCRLTPGLWTHKTRPISFTLVVDDFGVKYTRQQDADHLINALKAKYDITIDLKGSFMLGMSLDWNYEHRYVDISMPGYVEKALLRFSHQKPTRQQDSPFPFTEPTYGQPIQYANPPDTTPLLSAADTKQIQEIVGVFLYYARGVDPTMLPALNELGSQQSKPTERTAAETAHFLNYAACHPDAVLRIKASDMVMHIHSDASYLCAPNSRSRVAGHYFLSALPADHKKPYNTHIPSNAPFHTECKTLRNVLASATEAELGALFHNGQTSIPFRHALEELGHPQPPTPIQTDNQVAFGIVNSSIRQRRTKAMDMRFHWVQDRCSQGHFVVYWAPGRSNGADYFTKHHPAYHHRIMRSKYLHAPTANYSAFSDTSTPVQGCVIPAFSPRNRIVQITRRLRESLQLLSLIS